MRSHVAPMSPTPIERLWNLAFHSAHTLRACETRGFMVGCLSSTRTPRSTDAVWWCTSKLRTACFKPFPPARSPGSPQRGTCFMTHAGSTTISLCRNLGACSLRLRLQKTVLALCIEARPLQPRGCGLLAPASIAPCMFFSTCFSLCSSSEPRLLSVRGGVQSRQV